MSTTDAGKPVPTWEMPRKAGERFLADPAGRPELLKTLETVIGPVRETTWVTFRGAVVAVMEPS